MKVNMKQILRKIGFIASYLPCLLVSVFFLLALHISNQGFFGYAYPGSIFSESLLQQIVMIFLVAAVAVVGGMAIVSFTMRQNKLVNKALIWGCAGFSVLCMIFFIVMCQLNSLYDLALGNVNLYLIYFFMAAFSTAIVLFSAIRNLVRIKRTPVSFAKSKEQPKRKEQAAAAEADTDPITE